MNRNIAQEIELRDDKRWYIRYDWYPLALPDNLVLEDMVYLDSAYSFGCFNSKHPEGFRIGYGSGNYLRSHFFSGEKGKISVGKYVILEATHILVNDAVIIGDHCMFSWGSVITDSWLDESTLSSKIRREILKRIATSETRILKMPNPRKVVVEDNVWVGFGSVILPGVKLGRGCVIGCKTVISNDVPPYAVVVGNPPQIVRYLNPDDSEEERTK